MSRLTLLDTAFAPIVWWNALHFVKHRSNNLVLLFARAEFYDGGQNSASVKSAKRGSWRTKRSNVAEGQKTKKPPKTPKESLWYPVYQLVKQIPRGRVLSYGALAKALRLRGGARSAGRAMAATPQGHGIPWHRVLAANGRIVIRGEHALLQRKLLESEGIPVMESRVKMKDHLWTPARKKKTQRNLAPRANVRGTTHRESERNNPQ